MSQLASPARRVLPYGEQAMLVELDSLADAREYFSALAAETRAGVIDIVPAARTVLLRFEPTILPRDSARTWLQQLRSSPAPAAAPKHADAAGPFSIDVVYDGEDLDSVAAVLGVSREEVIARHSEREWTVAFGGFAPGFGYLVPADGLDSGLHLARHEVPRTSVPAGAVGLAGEFSGVYPRASPGGWQIIGTSPTPLWEPSSAEPAPLLPGRRVRFRPIRALPPERSALVSETAASAGAPALTVLEPGPLTLLQDRGRPGNGAIGVSPSGALDRGASALANRLLGNPAGAATLEVTVGGLSVRFESPVWIALTGADGRVTIDDALVELDRALEARAGSVLRIPIATAGLRYYLAVRGGLEARAFLGSRSHDTLSGLGPAPIAAGDLLGLGAEPSEPIPSVPMSPAWPPTLETVTVHLHIGPRAGWLEPESLERLFEQRWVISAQSNRVGTRLEGEPLVRARADELPSEGMVAGAIQLPPSGLPTVLLADHPVTGGYPVIAVVAEADLDRFAQLRPGQGVRFRHAR